jgi:hypothetical protein
MQACPNPIRHSDRRVAMLPGLKRVRFRKAMKQIVRLPNKGNVMDRGAAL